MINYSKPVIVIAGPTVTGKSSLAIKLAKDINGYIINADSRQVYKELRIGTAQPVPDIVKDDVWYINGVKHYLYGHVSAKKRYNLYQYQKDVQRALDKKNGIPVLVGGTGLYIDCIVYNYKLKQNEYFSTEYSREELEKMSVKELQAKLEKETLEKLNSSDRNNPVRLIRAIERGGVNREKGEVLNHLYTVVDIEDNELKERISKRVDLMVEQGLVEEVKDLLDNGFNFEMSAMQSIGYREFDGYFEKNKTLEQVKDEIVLHTIQYSKRQRTWFKRNRNIVKVDGYKNLYEEALKFLSIS
ncbi:MAG: tRNA dimethylallyltransferase [candidate division WS6 bacterium 34_10]|uniref:tRNA dimethylallyltransferase n=1 Tax=candidate division WS6 bacterium 34_10 TaxID=1641389 RepID=A0A117LZW3_9BACT|nr:MAG: tRNA dimethylallyltransferase [candidate division WS6 bacterium 34_10]